MGVLQIATLAALLVALISFAINFAYILKSLRIAQDPPGFGAWARRGGVFVKQVLGHEKLLRQPVAGVIHLSIFWGFVVLTLGTLEWFYYGLSGGKDFSFLGGATYGAFLFSQDLFNVLVLLAVLAALYRRLIVKPKRMSDNSWGSKADAYFILAMILGLVLSGLGTHSVAIQQGSEVYASYKPFSALIASVWPEAWTADAVYYTFWWAHLLIVLGFLNYLPFSKHLHVIVAAPNVLLSKTRPRGELTKLDLEDESIEKFGAEKPEELSWKHLLDAYSCTECGRCNEFCPTATTGKALRPKTLMIELRKATEERVQAVNKAQKQGEDQLAEAEKKTYEKCLVPDTFTDQFVWDCTTCGACVEACPVMIDHVDSIVEMRRALVLNQGSNPDEATAAFRNWETSSNPWGLPEESRQEWLVEKGVPLYEPEGDFEYLYYIGCAGSFDQRNKNVVDSVVAILQAAGVKFGILGKEEKCNGETARRMGNEWLAQEMIQTNLELLQGKMVKKVITSCPHCFNTLKNEYPAFGGDFEVIHHTELIDQLIQEGKLNLQSDAVDSVTYHDSCYIGRYNKIYDQPRNILSQVSAEKPREMKRSRERGFCCGAGGGRMWLEETTGERVNQNRTDEILGTGAKTVGVACPFCMTMISDGMKSKGREDVEVKDVAEIVAGAMKSG